MNKLFLYAISFSTLIVLLVASIALGIAVGSTYIPIDKVFSLVCRQITCIARDSPYCASLNSDPSYVIVVEIREPRTLAAVIGGAALAIAGLIYQIMFRNPIVGPYVLGVSSGASLAVGLVILAGISLGFKDVFAPYTIISAALLGAYAVTSLVLIAASIVRSVVTLLVIGLMIGYLCQAATSILMTFAEKERVHAYVMWTLGSFAGYKWSDVIISIAILVPLIISAMALSRPLNLLLLGEDYARTMGLNVRAFRLCVIGIASSLAAIVTAFAGPIGFIGVAVPHLARLLFRTSNNTVLLPATALLGAIVTTLCDIVARILFAPIELPINAVTSLFGAPLIIALLIKRRVRT